MQEAYVKRVIEIFKLKPEDLGTTPQYFCEVFAFCEAIETGMITLVVNIKKLLCFLKKGP